MSGVDLQVTWKFDNRDSAAQVYASFKQLYPYPGDVALARSAMENLPYDVDSFFEHFTENCSCSIEDISFDGDVILRLSIYGGLHGGYDCWQNLFDTFAKWPSKAMDTHVYNDLLGVNQSCSWDPKNGFNTSEPYE